MTGGLREAIEKLCETQGAGSYVMVHALRSALAAHPVESAPVASRERVAEVLLQERARHLDEYGMDGLADLPTGCRCGGWDADRGGFDEHIASRQVAALLAAGVFREPQPVEREAVIAAMARADGRAVKPESAAWRRIAEETCGRHADAVLALLAGEPS